MKLYIHCKCRCVLSILTPELCDKIINSNYFISLNQPNPQNISAVRTNLALVLRSLDAPDDVPWTTCNNEFVRYQLLSAA
jgi:hypothetical protein